MFVKSYTAENKESLRTQIWQVAITMIKDSSLISTGLGSWYHNESVGGYATWLVRGFK